MFFYISGMGTTFFNTEKKGFFIFCKSKVLRILVPFVISVFVFLIPRLYFGQDYENWTRPKGKTGPIEKNFFVYAKFILPNIKN